MLALISVWLGLGSFVLAAAMLLYRPAFTDWTVTAVLYFGVPGALCLGLLVLWAHRQKDSGETNLGAQRLQAKTALALAGVAWIVVYALIIRSAKIEPATDAVYNASPGNAQTIWPVAITSCKSQSTARNNRWKARPPWRPCSAIAGLSRFA